MNSAAAARCAVLLLAVALPAASPAPPPSRIAVRDVTVLTMTERGALPHQTVLVEGGVVAAIGPAANTVIPAGAQVIEGAGRVLAPGLVDLHVHLFSPDDLVPYLASGVTTVLNMHGTPDHLRWRRQVETGRLVGPRILTAGPTVDGLPPLNELFLTVETEAEGRTAVREQKAAGYDAVKLYGTLRPHVFEAILDEARRQRIPVVGHVNRPLGALAVLASTQALAAHADDLLAARFDEAPTEGDLATFADAVARSGMTLTANLTVGPTTIAQLEDLGGVLRSDDARLLSAAAYSQWLPANNRNPANDGAKEQIASLRAQQVLLRTFVRLLHERGAPLVLGTDSSPYGLPGVSAHEELAETVRSGLSPLDALATATSAAGSFLARAMPGVPRVGVVAPGASADLMLLAKDPRESVDNARAIEALVVRGRLYPRAELDALLAEQLRRNAEAKRVTDEADAAIEAHRVADAVRLLEPGARAGRPAIAEWVLWAKQDKLGKAARGEALALAEAWTRFYPGSFAAEYNRARISFAAGQLEDARTHVARALALAGGYASARNLDAKLRLVRVAPSFDPRGTYSLAPDGGVEPMRVTIDGPPWAGRITGPQMSEAQLTEVTAAGDRLWLRAPSDFGPVELRLTVAGDTVRGDFAAPFGRNGRVTGTRRPLPPAKD